MRSAAGQRSIDSSRAGARSYCSAVEEVGKRVWRELEEFDTADAGVHANWPPRFFARLVDTYLTKTNNQGGLVGNAQSVLLDSRGLLEFALPVMKAIAADASAVRLLAAQ